MAGASKFDKGELEELVSATKESYQSPANANTTGIAANVIESRRKLLESLVKTGDQLHAYPAVVSTPYLIWANPIDILIDSHVEPWNNRARVNAVHLEIWIASARLIGGRAQSVLRRIGKLLILRLTPRGLRRFRLETTRSSRISASTAS